MQTNFTPEQLRDPGIARSNEILRACVHCGFCTATCPTYQVLGDELDSPRGRIYLIKDMLEAGRPADEKTVRHIDRCLSCLACMTTCPSGVHYMHLVDHARDHIERTYRRPRFERWLRWTLARILPYPRRFRLALLGARIGRPFAGLLPDPRLRAMLEMAPKSIPPVSRMDDPQVFPAEGARRRRVALMTGCAQRALNTDINEATIRLLTRHGCEVVIAEGAGCCGALTHHMGKTAESHASAAKNIRAWMREVEGAGLDAIVINTSGCGTTVKDYGHMFRNDPLAAEAARVAGLARDVSEVMEDLGLAAVEAPPLRVAYHAACSLQHGQQIRSAPKALLKAAGFEVVEPRDAHLCCGSAGTYNLMQPEISAALKARKLATLLERGPEVIAAGNIGCMMQIGSATSVPVVHTVELLDWATGGPRPPALSGR
ncbi:MAG TPA: glycolate oxidase subunit GlcF [Amaricoccus sp.]|uniref:glycolate oxidase subunit GlcF n=1 Tax=Amaricoccus sp. TaxID=1872485 RepID=UPI002D1989CF|nr:glycolate oxidase subunit GlcF [Amaricoccus sp.]HMQ95101.1 glycolate oxidase subunit GlcF [Amaricoccus sp.]HMR52125.1 glycolate oxidase subunit GlcF [Amaricoccus sp.]HMT98927.1 glycolate oxidase subunit GlcF [Amaricoccus sp.]